MHHSPRKRNRRKGATLVEFAIAAPIVFLLFFTGYEFSRVNMVRHSLDIAAYEGARQGIVPGSTVNLVESRVRALLDTVAISDATINVTPGTIDNTTREVTVNIVAPMSTNGWITPRFLGSGYRLEANSTLAREGFTNSP